MRGIQCTLNRSLYVGANMRIGSLNQLATMSHNGSIVDDATTVDPSDLPIAAKLGITPHLSPPISTDKITPDTAYILCSSTNQYLVANNGSVTNDDWNYAILSTYENHPNWIHGVRFSTAAIQSDPAYISLGPPYADAWLRSANTSLSSNWNWVMWANNKSGNYSDYPMLQLYFTADSTLSTSDGRLVLCNDSKGNVYIGNKNDWPATKYSVHKYLLHGGTIFDMIQATWPQNLIKSGGFQTADRAFELIDDSKVNSIYKKSPLSKYEWVRDKFDCDDFSYVFKGAASTESYADRDSISAGYAVGVIMGINRSSGHAVNFFVDYSGSLKIIEPQNGTVINAADWEYTPDFVFI